VESEAQPSREHPGQQQEQRPVSAERVLDPRLLDALQVVASAHVVERHALGRHRVLYARAWTVQEAVACPQ